MLGESADAFRLCRLLIDVVNRWMRAKATGSAATDASGATARAGETSIAVACCAKRHAGKARGSIAVCTEGSAR